MILLMLKLEHDKGGVILVNDLNYYAPVAFYNKLIRGIYRSMDRILLILSFMG